MKIIYRSSLPDLFCKKMFLETSQNSQENTCASVSILIKLQTLTQVLSCEFCEVSKNTFFTEHLRWLLLNIAVDIWKLFNRLCKLLFDWIQINMIFKSSRSQEFFKIGVYKNFAKFKWKHLCWSLFLIKLHAWDL